MGTGTDVAMESAGVTLVKGDLRGIVRARRLSRSTMHNIKQNLFFAFLYNTAGVPIAAGVPRACSSPSISAPSPSLFAKHFVQEQGACRGDLIGGWLQNGAATQITVSPWGIFSGRLKNYPPASQSPRLA